MGSRLQLMAVACLFLVSLAVPAVAQDQYRLNAGDVLRVSVWREEGLERELLVQPDGMISFPLAGQVFAKGRTVSEIEAELTQKLDRFIPGPVVSVELIDARGNVVYVIGEVNNPGAFQLARVTTVMQALSQAGGFTPFAGRGRIRILREENGVQISLPFDYSDATNGRGDADVQLRAGDVIVVPGGSLF